MPDPNLDRLKAVSPTLTFRIRPSDRPRHPNVSTSVTFTEQDINTIAADILRLADDVEKAYHEGYDQGVTGQPRRKRVTPASAGGGKEDE